MNSNQNEREHHILERAAEVIIQQGYDKTTMSDIAEAAGVRRGILYLHFATKDALFEALVRREAMLYTQKWLDYIEADPRGGTVGSTYRGVLYAMNSRPFIAALMRRDQRTFGNYLRKPNNLFSGVQTSSVPFLQAMQNAGAIRADVNLEVMGYIADILAYGLVWADHLNDTSPPFAEVLEAIGTMLDLMLTPPEGSNSEAGKAILRHMATATQTHYANYQANPEQDGDQA